MADDAVGLCPFQGNGRVYVVSEAAALRQFLCFPPVLRAHPLLLLLTCKCKFICNF